jgi:hypothetical protein
VCSSGAVDGWEKQFPIAMLMEDACSGILFSFSAKGSLGWPRGAGSAAAEISWKVEKYQASRGSRLYSAVQRLQNLGICVMTHWIYYTLEERRVSFASVVLIETTGS